METLFISILQFNPVIGDLEGNINRILQTIHKQTSQKVDLIVTPELSLWGYSPKDYLFISKWIQKANDITQQLAEEIKSFPPLMLGVVEQNNTIDGPPFFNSAALLRNGSVDIVARKVQLPNYSVFNEKRYFSSLASSKTFYIKNTKIIVSICADIWETPNYQSSYGYYQENYIRSLEGKEFDLMINMSASPFEINKPNERKKLRKAFVNHFKKPLLYCNQVGANDDLIFDGRSFYYSKEHSCNELKAFEEDYQIIRIDNDLPNTKKTNEDLGREENQIQALTLGISDYVRKNNFQKVLLGLSGGIDSALVCYLATLALGKENVIPILLPSQYSSESSIQDATELARNLDLKPLKLPIQSVVEAFSDTLKTHLDTLQIQNLTEENLQSRTRGTILMALSNELKTVLLSTGNKSELSVGYCTIYGDMNGALAVIGDLWKTEVFHLCRWINQKKEIIPNNIISKPPSAELRPNQTDQDTLPDYELLDSILRLFIEKHLSPEAIIAEGFEPSMVQEIFSLIKKSEFKRYQSPPILKLSIRSLGGLDWQMPLSSTFPS